MVFSYASCRYKFNTVNRGLYSGPVAHHVLIQGQWIAVSLILGMKHFVPFSRDSDQKAEICALVRFCNYRQRIMLMFLSISGSPAVKLHGCSFLGQILQRIIILFLCQQTDKFVQHLYCEGSMFVNLNLMISALFTAWSSDRVWFL